MAWSALQRALIPVPLLLCGLLSACPGPRERITLLDVEEGGFLTVSTPQQTTTLTTALETAQVTKSGQVQVGTTTTAAVEKRYGAILATTPAAARRYTIPFGTGAATLPLDADATIAALLEDVAQHPAVEVQITGHTDTTGAPVTNDRLSEARAVAVREALIARGLHASFIRVVGRGERDLAIPTADNVSEPRNRRVVVTVR